MRPFLKSSLLLLTFLAGWPAGAQSPEELYQEYMTPETRAILERAEEAERHAEEAAAAARAQKTLALAGAFLIGLIPLLGTARKIIKNKSWDQRRDESVLALFTSLAGGGVLFAINYGLFLLKIRMGDAFHTAFVFLIVAVLIAGSVYLYRKKD